MQPHEVYSRSRLAHPNLVMELPTCIFSSSVFTAQEIYFVCTPGATRNAYTAGANMLRSTFFPSTVSTSLSIYSCRGEGVPSTTPEALRQPGTALPPAPPEAVRTVPFDGYAAACTLQLCLLELFPVETIRPPEPPEALDARFRA